MKIIDSKPKRLRNPEEKRRDKAIEIFLKGGQVIPIDADGIIFKVKSQCEDGFYTVMLGESEQGCTCADFVYRGATECKHILAAYYMRHELGYAAKPLPSFTNHDRIYCHIHHKLYEKSDSCSECSSN